MKTVGLKNSDTRRKNLLSNTTSSLYTLLLFKNFVIALFSASQNNFKAPAFRINAASLRTYQWSKIAELYRIHVNDLAYFFYNTSARDKWHECDTSNASATWLQQEQHTCVTNATSVQHKKVWFCKWKAEHSWIFKLNVISLIGIDYHSTSL